MAAHAELSPSASERWMTCYGSVQLIAKLRAAGILKPEVPSFPAAEGSAAHHVRQMCLSTGLDPHDFIGNVLKRDGFEITVDQAMADHLLPGIDRIRSLPGRHLVEKRLPLDAWLPGSFGTCDFGTVYDDVLENDDFKFGYDPVDPVGIKQGRIYSLMVWEHFGRPRVKRVIITIDQPRVRGGGGSWEITLDELLAFGEEVREAGRRTQEPDAPLKASIKGCHWCPLNPRPGVDGPGCAELERFNLDLVGSKFEDIDHAIEMADMPPRMPNPSAMTPERLSYVWRHRKMFSDFIAGAGASLNIMALRGDPTPDLKLVDGAEGDRYFTDSEAAAAILVPIVGEEEAYTKKLIGPAGAQKLLKPTRKFAGHPEAWEDLQALIKRDPGAPVLVGLDDPRPARKTNEERFEDMDA